MKNLITLIKAHPLYAIWLAALLVVLFFSLTGGIGRALDSWRANRFDAKQVAYEKQIGDLKTEREALIKRADDAESKALLKEAEAKELKDLIDQKGGAIEKAANDMEKQIEDAKRNAGGCAGDPDPRGCTCAKLRAAGFSCQ